MVAIEGYPLRGTSHPEHYSLSQLKNESRDGSDAGGCAGSSLAAEAVDRQPVLSGSAPVSLSELSIGPSGPGSAAERPVVRPCGAAERSGRFAAGVHRVSFGHYVVDSKATCG